MVIRNSSRFHHYMISPIFKIYFQTMLKNRYSKLDREKQGYQSSGPRCVLGIFN